MAQIRKKSLKAAVWIYFGFFIGAVNTYFLTHKNWFEPDEYGLTRGLIEISQLIFAFSTLGVTSYLYKFFPYYEDNLEPKRNDLLSIALVVSLVGFLFTAISLWLLEPLMIRKFSENSMLLVEYFYWTIPMAFFVLLYNVLEAYSYGFHKGVLTSLLRETGLRLYTMVIIVLKVLGFISFKTFIILFCLQYGIIFFILAIHLYKQGQLWISFQVSRVTLKFRKKIFAIMALTFIVIIVSVLRQAIDGLVLAATQSLEKVGIFGLAAYMVSVMQAPFRSIVAITVPILSRAWKTKNYADINRIYKRSSINLLSFALFIFFCIWLNFSEAIAFFNINPDYLEGKWVFFLLGIVTIIELGTGVNGQIIGTSSFWRFELWTSLLLTVMIIPLSYFLTVRYGIIGPAVANLLSFSVYNFVRFRFLWKRFDMQPFSDKTVEVLAIALLAYVCCYYTFLNVHGLAGMIGRTLAFILIYGIGMYVRKITPDLQPILVGVLRRLHLVK